MKKTLLSMIALAALAGCTSYDYYEGGVKYVQDGRDCIYYSGEYGSRFSSDIDRLDTNKRIVYRNTQCADLYARDNFGAAPRQDRVILAPAAVESVYTPCNTCGCTAAMGQPKPISRSKYVIVPAK